MLDTIRQRPTIMVGEVSVEKMLEGIMNDVHLTLTADEAKYLVEVLEESLKSARIEEHRTRTPSYRQHVLDHEALIGGILAKLSTPTVA